jgi:hypothetical protein
MRIGADPFLDPEDLPKGDMAITMNPRAAAIRIVSFSVERKGRKIGDALETDALPCYFKREGLTTADLEVGFHYAVSASWIVGSGPQKFVITEAGYDEM